MPNNKYTDKCFIHTILKYLIWVWFWYLIHNVVVKVSKKVVVILVVHGGNM